jgi:hypothetical protein
VRKGVVNVLIDLKRPDILGRVPRQQDETPSRPPIQGILDYSKPQASPTGLDGVPNQIIVNPYTDLGAQILQRRVSTISTRRPRTNLK